MADKAKKATINFGGNQLEVYQLPSGIYKFSQTQAAKAVGKDESSFRRFLNNTAPKLLPPEDLVVGEVQVEGSNILIKASHPKVILMYWDNQAEKKNVKAKALLAAGTEETLNRLADQAFGVNKSEVEYQQETLVNIQQNEQLLLMLQTLQKTLEDVRKDSWERQQQMEEKLNLLLPYVEEGKVAKTLYKYLPNFENLLKQVAQEFDSNLMQDYKILKHWTYELGFRDLSHGEKIAIGKIASGFAILGDPDWLPDSNKKGRKKYPEAFKPVIKEATLYVLSKRRHLRLIA